MPGFFRFDQLEVDLYTLYSVVNSEAQPHPILQDSRVEEKVGFVVYLAEQIVEPLLISCAVRIRMIEQKLLGAGIQVDHLFQPSKIITFTVGEPTKADQQKSGLWLAADKIVHATRVSFYDDGKFDDVRLDGDLSGRPWQVELHVPQFALAGIYLFNAYDESPVSGRGPWVSEPGR